MLFLGVDSNIKGPGRWSIESLYGGALQSRKTVNQIDKRMWACLNPSLLVQSDFTFFLSRFFWLGTIRCSGHYI